MPCWAAIFSTFLAYGVLSLVMLLTIISRNNPLFFAISATTGRSSATFSGSTDPLGLTVRSNPSTPPIFKVSIIKSLPYLSSGFVKKLMGYFFSASIFSLESKRLGNGMATVVATIFFRKFLRLSIIYLVIISMGLCIRNVKNHLLSHYW